MRVCVLYVYVCVCVRARVVVCVCVCVRACACVYVCALPQKLRRQETLSLIRWYWKQRNGNEVRREEGVRGRTSFFEDEPLVDFIYLVFARTPGGVAVGDSGLCCCVPCLSSAIISLRLLTQHKHSRPHSVSDYSNSV